MSEKVFPGVLLFLVIILQIGCSSKKNATHTSEEACDTIRIEASYSQRLTKELPTFISDTFTNKAVETFTIESLQKKHSKMLPLKKEPFRNIHDSSKIDTIYHFSGKKDTIKFYCTHEKNFMIYLHLVSPELSLNPCIRPGISKTRFKSFFGISRPVGDTIQIANSDGTLRFIFYFTGDLLKQIESDFYFG
ncbi:MAG: hypothetical protein ACLFM7_03140 [Bacteroidales bacterium]